ncbi:hypothetical protein COW36_05845 [bacterium (Candidatus Blackallbacteria) CG17_big_fil_post_rev_8_21_14_2_50_48_46]|uniref:Uncharacterized protein n=1 Tax=bacterium (Candidatus Blackallbacteria) CG17_big_fil_post_rev_8_21_14_2_50_48_46 TaxID=2014261 RepID=A0A2M7G880_9BACT|nr:MAG: hypothetical protein COW64_21440 [bacterium (Candidatus Blackallbacteria) CG18_big_fil_WC_8_21_14_2_50_49_26]PIW18289.1 MAG: hypothetical protein COW36_05845 [bacterium (Candidatus Blackallbacteria) CG17_big_fil_post_rev_8_21_14_2_50_48_46]PIW49513.1 MAG: hypothetical protein COW20_05660 [bacterium (Candidatus Blackallbacteria) CG13_big_fil_rev_8_21_14_2_50_49_14]
MRKELLGAFFAGSLTFCGGLPAQAEPFASESEVPTIQSFASAENVSEASSQALNTWQQKLDIQPWAVELGAYFPLKDSKIPALPFVRLEYQFSKMLMPFADLNQDPASFSQSVFVDGSTLSIEQKYYYPYSSWEYLFNSEQQGFASLGYRFSLDFIRFWQFYFTGYLGVGSIVGRENSNISPISPHSFWNWNIGVGYGVFWHPNIGFGERFGVRFGIFVETLRLGGLEITSRLSF